MVDGQSVQAGDLLLLIDRAHDGIVDAIYTLVCLAMFLIR